MPSKTHRRVTDILKQEWAQADALRQQLLEFSLPLGEIYLDIALLRNFTHKKFPKPGGTKELRILVISYKLC